MKHRTFEQRMLDHYHIAFDRLALAGRSSGLSTLANHLDDISANLRKIWEEELDEENRLKLIGKGPLLQMKQRLGLVKAWGPNLLEQHSEEERFTSRCLHQLLVEFISPNVTYLKRGGTYDELLGEKELPSDPEKLEMGTYRHAGTRREWAPAIVIQVVEGRSLMYLVITFKQDPHNPYDAVVLTYVDGEKEWVAHRHYEVLRRSTVRKSLVGLLKKFKPIPLPVPLEDLQELLTSKLSPSSEEKHRNIETSFQGYRIAANWIDQGVEKPYYKIVITDNEMRDAFTGRYTQPTVPWNELSDTKKRQLFETLSIYVRGRTS